MDTKTLIIVVLLFALIILAYLFYKKSNAVKEANPVIVRKSEDIRSDDDEEDEKPVTKKGRKVRMKHSYNWVLKTFNEEIPLTAESILEKYNSKHKEVNITKIKAIIKWLEKNGFIDKEEVEGGDTYYGPNDWFEDGSLSEEYFEKLKTT